MNKTWVLGLGTLLLFGSGAYYLIEVVQERSFTGVFLRGMNLPVQVAVGTGYGLLTALIALLIISRDFFKKEKNFYSQLISQLDLNIMGILFLSFCAGIAEEAFFRAGLQPLLGVWPTSIIFVFIHGYLNPFNWRISLYGFAMLFFIAGMGFLFIEIGLIAAIASHTVLDIVLFMKLRKRPE